MSGHHAGHEDCTAGDCPRCDGIGYLPDEPGAPDCDRCRGTGWLEHDPACDLDDDCSCGVEAQRLHPTGKGDAVAP